MTLKDKFQIAWKNRAQITEGFFNTVIGCRPELEAEAQRRLAICKGCKYWDPTGMADIFVVKGRAGCSICGCEGNFKAHCFNCHCSLKDLDPPQEPLWEALWDDEVEKHLRDESYKQQKPL